MCASLAVPNVMHRKGKLPQSASGYQLFSLLSLMQAEHTHLSLSVRQAKFLIQLEHQSQS